MTSPSNITHPSPPPQRPSNSNTTTTTTTTFIQVRGSRVGVVGATLLPPPSPSDNSTSNYKYKGEMPPYSVQTGIRIATTLGSFFLFVLLTLLYKSKCKKHSRGPSPTLPLQLDMATPTPQQFINSLSQIHPYNHCPPTPQPHLHRQPPHPALLLTTHSASSSSEEEEEEEEEHLASRRALRSGLSPPGRIDIHVILPTPTMTPSSSGHFLRGCGGGGGSGGGGSGGGGGSVGSSFWVDNLKYVDDTSSENIPAQEEQEEDDGHSIGSDSVFVLENHTHQPPPPPPYSRRVSSVSGYSGLSGGWGMNVAYGYPPMTPSPHRLSTSGGEEEGGGYIVGGHHLTQAQVHHRDSFCSELEWVNDYMEGTGVVSGGGGRRCSSTQTTFSDLQHCLSLVGGGVSVTPRLSPNNNMRQSLRTSGVLLTPGGVGGGSSRGVGRGGRKQSVDAVLMRKAYTLQCDECSN